VSPNCVNLGVSGQLWERFEFIYAPKHGSWLNAAEIEMNVLIRQCLDHRIDTFDKMRTETGAWQQRRNHAESLIDCQFTTDDARVS